METNSAHDYDNRSIDCVGSDAGFTLLWGEHDADSFCLLGSVTDRDLPTKFARLSADGQLLGPGPIRANVATSTRSTATVAVGGGLLALSEDPFSLDTIQSRRLDADGAPAFPGREISAGQYSDERCSWARVEALRVRPQGDKAFAAYQWTKVVGPEPEHGLSMIQVDEVDDDGLLVQRHSFALIDWFFGPNQPTQIDATPMAGGIAAAFDVKLPQYEPLPPRVHVLFESEGHSKTERVIDNGTMTASPTLASLGDSLLVVWSELIGDRWQLRRAVVDPAGQTPIVGDTFLEEPGSLQYPWLIRGEDQLLCAWWSDAEVHAARLDSRGRVLDTSPLILSAGPAVPGPIDGVWSGLSYVVAWRQGSSVRANRVTSRGRVADGLGLEVGKSQDPPGALASLPDGKVAIPYGDRIRFLTDQAVPVAPVSLAVQATSRGVQLQWEVSGEFGGVSSRLARRALRSPHEVAPPPEGYVRIAADMDFGGAGSHRYLDAEVDAGQWYAYAIALPMQDGSLVWSTPSLVQAQALTPSLALSAPMPNPVRGVANFRFSLPATRDDARLEIFDAAGRLVRRIALGPIEAGSHELAWDGLDDAGLTSPSGLFLARLSANGSKTVRFLRLR